MPIGPSDPNLPVIAVSTFSATMVDNRSSGIHRAGYNGVALLQPSGTRSNIFVPLVSGLNYEAFVLAGLPADIPIQFEPRTSAMHLVHPAPNRVTLVQPPTPHGGVRAAISFKGREPCYLDLAIELEPGKRFVALDSPNPFAALWASYIYAPADVHIYTRSAAAGSDPLAGWFGVTKKSHDSPDHQWRPLPARTLSVGDHLELMQRSAALPARELRRRFGSDESFDDGCTFRGPLAFYYGLTGRHLFLLIFKQPQRVRLAYSPAGVGSGRPAWDFLTTLRDAEVGRTYHWDVRLVFKPFAGRRDVLDEVETYLSLPTRKS